MQISSSKTPTAKPPPMMGAFQYMDNQTPFSMAVDRQTRGPLIFGIAAMLNYNEMTPILDELILSYVIQFWECS